MTPRVRSFTDFGVPRRPYTAAASYAARGRSRNTPKKMVTRARFERATPSFGGWCSIQLSYRATWWDVLDSNQ